MCVDTELRGEGLNVDAVRRGERVSGYRAEKGRCVWIPCIEGKVCVFTVRIEECVCGYRA